jgi:hypothetical protein
LTEPYITPWSVRARPGMFWSFAKEIKSRIRLAPSSIEYSEWQCKCAKGVAVKPLLPYVSRWNGRRGL